MTLASDLLSIVSRVRAIPGQLGLRPYTVTVSVRSLSGAYGLEGDAGTVTTSILEHGGFAPKLRFLNDEQLTLGGMPKGTIELGPITPAFTGGGTLLATITGSAIETGELLHFTVTGPEFPEGALYRLTSVKSDQALHYTLTLSPIAADS